MLRAGWQAGRVGDRPRTQGGLMTHGAKHRFYPGRHEKPRRVPSQERRNEFLFSGEVMGGKRGPGDEGVGWGCCTGLEETQAAWNAEWWMEPRYIVCSSHS